MWRHAGPPSRSHGFDPRHPYCRGPDVTAACEASTLVARVRIPWAASAGKAQSDEHLSRKQEEGVRLSLPASGVVAQGQSARLAPERWGFDSPRLHAPGSSNGRTRDFGPRYGGSIPSPGKVLQQGFELTCSSRRRGAHATRLRARNHHLITTSAAARIGSSSCYSYDPVYRGLQIDLASSNPSLRIEKAFIAFFEVARLQGAQMWLA